jgi:hypothetical protein
VPSIIRELIVLKNSYDKINVTTLIDDKRWREISDEILK